MKWKTSTSQNAYWTMGTITTYDFSSGDRNAYSKPEYGNLKLVYLGCGVLYSLDGKRQNSTYKMHFFRKIGF